MVCLNKVPYRFESKETLFKLLCLMLLIHIGLMDSSPSVTFSLCEYICVCRNNQTVINCEGAKLRSVPKAIPGTVKYLHLGNNAIRGIGSADFSNLPELEVLILNRNIITKIEAGAFENLQKLRHLNLANNYLPVISPNIFQHLPSLELLVLNANRIRNVENGAFLFLPKISKIHMANNRELVCGCHIPALVKYIEKTYQRHLNTTGNCYARQRNSTRNVGQELPDICKGYSLFQERLDCQMDVSLVTSCEGPEPVCMNRISMSGVTRMSKTSCSTYRECVLAVSHNVFTCNYMANRSSCVSCCAQKSCKKSDFIETDWTHTFVLNLTFTVQKDFSDDLMKLRSKEYHDLAKNISVTLKEELSKLKGTYLVKVVFFQFPKVTADITIQCTVPIYITEVQVWHMIYNILNTSKALDYLNIQRDTIKLTGEMLCNANTTSGKKGTFEWPVTNIGMTIKFPCIANPDYATRSCAPITQIIPPIEGDGTFVGEGNRPFNFIGPPVTAAWKQPNMSRCYDTDWITKALQQINSFDIIEQNIEKRSSELLNITQYAVYFEVIDVDLCMEILEKLMPWISKISAITTMNNILQSLNNMINTREHILVQAEESKQSANGMLNMIGRIPDEIRLEKQQLKVLYSNLGIGVTKMENDTFNGLLYGISSATNAIGKINNMIYNASYAQLEIMAMMDFISLPKSLLEQLNDEDRSRISRISFHSLQTDKLYRVIDTSRKKTNSNREELINSRIMAANIPNIQITNLDEPVNISFSLLHKNATNPRCVYWDETPGQTPNWSTKGCNTYNIVPGEKVSCSCNHLTSFALLMDVYQDGRKDTDAKPLSMISNIGCGISVVCLIITVLIHVCSKTLRKGIFSKILINLCVSLAIADLIFLVGMQPFTTKSSIIVCKAMAALLHYFLMVSIMWMAVEAFHIYLAVVIVFKTYLTNYMLKSSIIAWGLPAVIVTITLAINYTDNYIKITEVCWLSQTSFYAAFLFPVATILIFNLTIFILIIWRLISMNNDKKFEHKARKLRLFGIVGVFFLLGLSWILAFFAISEAAKIFNYLFAIFNTLQGLFIFIFYCIYKKDVRDVMFRRCTMRQKDNLKKGTKHKTNTQESSKAKDHAKDHAIPNTYSSDSGNGTASTKHTSSDDSKPCTQL